MSRARLRLALAALATTVLFAGALPASADNDAKTQIKIKRLRHSGASGTVSSGHAGCEANRKVRFFRIEDFISVKVQFTHTDSAGGWRIERDLKDGRYFAKVDSDGAARCIAATTTPRSRPCARKDDEMRPRRIRSTIAALGVGALALAASPAQAGEQAAAKAKTKVKITQIDATGASGTARSKNDACEAAAR